MFKGLTEHQNLMLSCRRITSSVGLKMAQVQSFGLPEPSALPYLIAESILPADPSTELYKWDTYGVLDETGHETLEEEVLATRECVVWSRSRVVKRVYNLEIEGEAILQAFVASFPARRKGI